MTDARAEAHPPIRLMTRCLAEMQTSIVAAGIRAFKGDLDRFVIYTLIVRQGTLEWESGTAVAGAISAHSLAASLSRPFETVRRHVQALIEAGLCRRVTGGVVLTEGALDRTDIRELLVVAHDSLVRLIEEMARFGIELPEPRVTATPYDPAFGLQAAADMMLAVVDSNMQAHREWLNLVIFSTILCANARPYSDDPVLAMRYSDQTQVPPDSIRSAVRASVVARTLGLPDSTLRRHVATLLQYGSVRRVRGGLLVDKDWLNTPAAVAISRTSYGNIRRILNVLQGRSFPFGDPASAYVRGRPDPAPFV
ncbi:hypothetical protein P1X14_02680 [Sphingomonas sp. AOB5]|uniref:hypothetical protein n=1 Tax=Sphingomonas sp. AOB5 TaxID=3034017 RepID=UPI0023F80E33|nr:hypothetical protein [Sphingomonas sp. AOB5]MDF7774141.1 hypothetical protein [Sphingomonas sp. AOB5]